LESTESTGDVKLNSWIGKCTVKCLLPYSLRFLWLSEISLIRRKITSKKCG